MKKTFILFASAISLLMVSCSSSQSNADKTTTTDSSKTPSASVAQNFSLDTTTLKAGDKYYQCEMNPEIISDKAGNCPTCGMELSELKKQ